MHVICTSGKSVSAAHDLRSSGAAGVSCQRHSTGHSTDQWQGCNCCMRARGGPHGDASQLTCMLLCLHSYGLIKVDLQEAELDIPDRYTASVAIGEQVQQGAAFTHVKSRTICTPHMQELHDACGSLQSLRIKS